MTGHAIKNVIYTVLLTMCCVPEALADGTQTKIPAKDLSGIEVHLSNVHAREPFRAHSYFSDIAAGVISGLGAQGYELALGAAISRLEPNTAQE